jgi:hypothetical protein
MYRTNRTGSETRDCTGKIGERSAACDLPDSASGCRRPARPSGRCSPKDGAAGKRPSESSLETSDQSYREQHHLRAERIVVRVGRRAPYLEATRDLQP